jgi:hypothetical protein
MKLQNLTDAFERQNSIILCMQQDSKESMEFLLYMQNQEHLAANIGHTTTPITPMTSTKMKMSWVMAPS